MIHCRCFISSLNASMSCVEMPKTLGFWVPKSLGFFAALGFKFWVLGGYFSLGKMEFWRKILQKFTKSIMKFEIWPIFLFMMNIPIFRNFS